MKTNLELKAKFPNIKRAVEIAKSLSETEGEVLEQTDTYYNVPEGRLKLREIKNGGNIQSELIWYDRDEEGEERISHYERVPLDDAEGFTAILTHSLGADVKVQKQRTVYIWNNCRIHIDLVEQLGPYVEFEVTETQKDNARERLNHLIETFGITELDIINCSYADLARTL